MTLDLAFLVTSSGAVHAAALVGDRVVHASEALDLDDPLDPDELPSYSFYDDLGSWLDVEYARGSAARIAHHFTLDA